MRRRLGPGEHGRPRFSDVLGELVALDAQVLGVRRDDGAVVQIALAEVEAAKRIPPRPARYSEIAALELVADRAWPAPVVDRLGDWRLRSAQGWTARANSALPVGDAGMPLDQAIEACARWYADRGQPAMITVPLPLRRDLDDALSTRAWAPAPTVLVQVADLAAVHDAVVVDRTPLGDANLMATPTPELLAEVGARKSPLPPAAMAILTGPDRVQFAEVRDARGAVVASARAAVVDDWMHLGLVGVAQHARRQGLAQLVTARLVRWAHDCGATRAVLQVEEHNTAAFALYQRLGFRTHHRYRTFRAP